jgi:hypothetical protein
LIFTAPDFPISNDTPELKAIRLERARKHEKMVRNDKKAAAPLLEDLAKIGIVVEHPADLFQEEMDYREAIPILLK